MKRLTGIVILEFSILMLAIVVWGVLRFSDAFPPGSKSDLFALMILPGLLYNWIVYYFQIKRYIRAEYPDIYRELFDRPGALMQLNIERSEAQLRGDWSNFPYLLPYENYSHIPGMVRLKRLTIVMNILTVSAFLVTAFFLVGPPFYKFVLVGK